MKYDVILADPPWHFQNYAADEPGKLHNRSRGANRYYPTMLTEDICKLEIPAADNAVLFLWGCFPMTVDAIAVINAWGFELKTIAWIWIKLNRSGIGWHVGQGYYTRSNPEPCWLATRGRMPVATRDQRNLVMTYEDGGPTCLKGTPMASFFCTITELPLIAPIRKHSKKPNEQYNIIEELYPGMRYLEMFARRPQSGWDVWGNEVDSSPDAIAALGRPERMAA